MPPKVAGEFRKTYNLCCGKAVMPFEFLPLPHGSTPRSLSIARGFCINLKFMLVQSFKPGCCPLCASLRVAGAKGLESCFLLKILYWPFAASGTCKTVLNPSNILLQAPGHTRFTARNSSHFLLHLIVLFVWELL